MIFSENTFLKQLISDLAPDPVIVNIGAATGVSTLAFLEERGDVFIFSVDIHECPQEFVNLENAGFSRKQVVRLLGDSKVIGKKFPESCDLLFVDGDHWGAKKDADIWADKVEPGGIIAYHDWQPDGCAPNNPGSVTEDVLAWWEEHPEVELIGEVERVIAFRWTG